MGQQKNVAIRKRIVDPNQCDQKKKKKIVEVNVLSFYMTEQAFDCVPYYVVIMNIFY